MSESNAKGNSNNYEINLELIKKAKLGDKKALDELVEKNLPLVTAISKKFLNRGYEYEDIFQIGSMGLIKAINNFDSSYNVQFSTYAVPMIMGEIRRFIRDDGLIKVSRSVKYTARKLHFDKEKLTKKLNREPTVEELSKFSGIDKEQIIFATEAINEPKYLYDTIHQDDGSPIYLIDKVVLKDESEIDELDKIALKEALSKLDQRSRQIIILRYFKDITQVKVAKMLGISQVQVSRIEKKVLKTMKEKLSG
ncbi:MULTISPECIES: RNA polymerase sporulation sigma factor SigF [Clostridium]|uniref:RNA polymerase sigma-F factor n=1 Tax=Clostridium novyi (strain NT) TaxID=386415 RepID=A0PZS7_CLONN|nr:MULTISPECIES: RNA polymerase sporulation sigma factor SigF [Clostridium]ABK61143.1 RNA polymerase sigma-F factor [Clostridium novyi NT]KEH84983.1 sporulation sigma factor SigG [Clostridium novyi A str. 4540]KEH86643.1 sporulation sigma factor SigG [Clostridium novyi A str. BKT29909]KEH88417.1 sporulation sigma factor SigG [Clostridium novyi A str. NCTC 538]KEH90445.1 sporulation sigma factor SigG [Clostridium novyi A str. GD211209]